MSETYFIDEFDPTLDVLRAHRRRQEAERKRRWYRIAVVTCVTLIHISVVAILVQTRLVRVMREKPPTETQLLWLLLPRAAMSQGNQSESKAEDMVRQAYKAITLLPHVDVERPNAITLDYGLALGQAIACGAGGFEYLTPEGRARCLHKPWGFKYDRYGYIILDTGRPPQAAEEKPRPSDVMAHERNTAPVCPHNIDPNVPCLESILRGD